MCCRYRTSPLPPFPLGVLLTHETAMGSAILFSYPELSTIVGIQGTLTYAATSALPLMAFVFLGPIIRKKLPEGFIMTTWVRHRYGEIAGAYISFLT